MYDKEPPRNKLHVSLCLTGVVQRFFDFIDKQASSSGFSKIEIRIR
jgi:hypothetical protein